MKTTSKISINKNADMTLSSRHLTLPFLFSEMHLEKLIDKIIIDFWFSFFHVLRSVALELIDLGRLPFQIEHVAEVSVERSPSLRIVVYVVHLVFKLVLVDFYLKEIDFLRLIWRFGLHVWRTLSRLLSSVEIIIVLLVVRQIIQLYFAFLSFPELKDKIEQNYSHCW